MSSDQSISSDGARRSIARFAGTVWTIGSIVMAIVAFSTFARIGFDPDTGALFETGGGGRYGEYPWQVDDVPVAESDDGRTYSGDGDAVIRMPTPTTDPLQVTSLREADVRLSQTASGDIDPDTAADDREWPESVGYPEPDRPTVIFPYEGTLELWVQADEPWTLELSELDAEELTDVASGKGNALLVYRGDAVSAMFEFVGEGIFFVTAYSREEGQNSLIIESDPLKERHSWEQSDTVVFQIESDADRGAWSIAVDSYADEGSTPSPGATETPGSTDTPDNPTDQENP